MTSNLRLSQEEAEAVLYEHEGALSKWSDLRQLVQDAFVMGVRSALATSNRPHARLQAALRQAREYILDNGSERTIAPIIERIDDALRTASETSAVPPIVAARPHAVVAARPHAVKVIDADEYDRQIVVCKACGAQL